MAASLASGLVTLAVEIALLLVCRRRLRPISTAACVVLIALPFLLTGPAVLSGRVLAPIDLLYAAEPWRAVAAEHGIDEIHNPLLSDVMRQILPWQAAVRSTYLQGEWPLLNPFILGGDPLAGSAQPAPYWPVTLIGLLLPLAVLPNLLAAAVLFAAALGTFVFVRDLDVGEPGALVSATGFALSSFLMMWLLWPLAAAVAMLPWVLLGVRRVCADPRPSSTAGLAAALLLLLLAGHPETAVHVVFAAGLYALYELAVAPGRRVRAAVAGIAAGAVALALSAVFVLPVVDAITQSEEYGSRREHFASQDRSVEWPEAIGRARVHLLPFADGIPGREVGRRRDAFWLPTPSSYVGSVLLAPALLGLWRGRWRGRWVLLALGLAGVGAHVSAPGISELLAGLPLLDIALNDRLGFVAAFSLAVLAGLGVEAWRREGSGRPLALLSAAVVGLLAMLVVWQRPAMIASGLTEAFIATGSCWLLLPPAILAAVVAVRPGAAFGAALLLALLAGQRLGEVGDLYPRLPAEAFAPVVAPLDSIPRTGPPFRVVGERGTFTPNSSALYGLEDVRGYQAMNLLRRRLTDALWSEQIPVWSNRVDHLNDPLLEFLNVRYAIQNRVRRVPKGWRLVAHGSSCRLLERRRVLERAFVPRTVVTGLEPDRILERMAVQRDFARVAWIETGEAAGVRSGPAPNGPGTVRVSRRGSGLDLDVDMDGAGWVVVSETAWRGWRARSGGRELPLVFANVAYLGLHLEAGRHSVELRYLPASFVVGRAITAVTAGAILVALVVTRLPRRRMPAIARRRPSAHEGRSSRA